MKLFVVQRQVTEDQELVGVYSTREKADVSAERNARHYHQYGPLSEMYHKWCEYCTVTEVELDHDIIN